MPNRIIKESICTSDTIDRLFWFDEVVFYRLIVNCDDYGRFDGRIPILKSRLFPLKSNITDKSLMESINKLSTVGLVVLYEFEDKPYLQLTTWDKHQQIRARKSKYPAFESNCKQLISNDSKCSRNPIQSESNPNKESESKHACAHEDVFFQYAKKDEDLLSALRDFEKMRRSIKKPLSTDRAKKMILNELDKLTQDRNEKIAILNQSILHTWQTVYAIKDNRNERSSDNIFLQMLSKEQKK